MTGYFIGLIVGVVIGVVIVLLNSRIPKKTIGTLRVDQSDPDDKPYLFLELNKNSDVDAIKKQKYVTMKVNVENYLSQK